MNKPVNVMAPSIAMHKLSKIILVALTTLVMSTSALATIGNLAAGRYTHQLYLDQYKNVLAVGASRFQSSGQFAVPFIDAYQGTAPVHVGFKATGVATDAFRSFALRADGKVYMWGALIYNAPSEYGKPTLISGNLNAKDVTSDGYAAYIVTTDGDLYKFTFATNVLELVPGITGISKVYSSHFQVSNVAAVATDGSLYVLGNNLTGQLGLGDFADRVSFVKHPTLTNVKSVTFGKSHALYLLNDGTIMAAGSNQFGKLGTGAAYDFEYYELSVNYPVPAPVIYFNNDVKEVFTIKSGSFALLNDGTVWGWGWHNYSHNISETYATMVTELSEITEVSGNGGQAVMFMDTYGWIRGMGSDLNGLLGDGNNTEKHYPVSMLPPYGTEHIDEVFSPISITSEPVVVEDTAPVVETLPVIDVEEPEAVDDVEDTSSTVEPAACKPGYGYGDKNHCHSGPPGQNKKAEKKRVEKAEKTLKKDSNHSLKSE